MENDFFMSQRFSGSPISPKTRVRISGPLFEALSLPWKSATWSEWPIAISHSTMSIPGSKGLSLVTEERLESPHVSPSVKDDWYVMALFQGHP